MAVAVIAGLAALYALLVLVGLTLARAAATGDGRPGRVSSDEPFAAVGDRRRATAQPWSGVERRRPGRAVLS